MDFQGCYHRERLSFSYFCFLILLSFPVVAPLKIHRLAPFTQIPGSVLFSALPGQIFSCFFDPVQYIPYLLKLASVNTCNQGTTDIGDLSKFFMWGSSKINHW